MPTTWEQFNAAAEKLKAAGIIPLGPRQPALAGRDRVRGRGARRRWQRVLQAAPSSIWRWMPSTAPTMIKVFDQMRTLQGFTDEGAPGRDWNVATGMVMEGKAAFQIMGDWAKGEFTKRDSPPARTITACRRRPSTGICTNVDSFIFYSVKDTARWRGRCCSEPDDGQEFPEGIQSLQGIDPGASSTCPWTSSTCARKGSASDLNYAGNDRWSAAELRPRHGTCAWRQKGAIQDVVTEHFNSDMSSQERPERWRTRFWIPCRQLAAIRSQDHASEASDSIGTCHAGSHRPGRAIESDPVYPGERTWTGRG